MKKLKIPQIYTLKISFLIQWGCDSFCTFCLTVKKKDDDIIIETKDDIVEEILELKGWWKEVVLTGINLSAWYFNR